jgi:L-2-hydroxyglutarate oxidase LhgO
MRKIFMRGTAGAILLAGLAFAESGTYHAAPAADTQSPTAGSAATVETGVRDFMRHLAHEVTEDGPAAWHKYFADTPAFFMAVNGKIAFASGTEAMAGLQQVAAAIKQIELKWGDDLRVDPLAPDLAVVAASYHESQVWADGRRVEDSGYFTGVAQSRDARWQFRDCHWSEPVSLPPAH